MIDFSIDKVKDKLGDYLQAQGINIKRNFACPVRSHQHDDTAPATSFKGQKVVCFKCKGEGIQVYSWDVLDLYAVDYLQAELASDGSVNYTFADAYNGLIDYLHLDTDRIKPSTEQTPQNAKKDRYKLINGINDKIITGAKNRLADTDYLSKRGISNTVAEKYGVGYYPDWQSPTALVNGANPPKTPRLIIPTGKHSYLARDVRDEIPPEQAHYTKMHEGHHPLFNAGVLDDTSKPVFVVEGEIDALSVIELAGAKAGVVGLGSIANAGNATSKTGLVAELIRRRKKACKSGTDYNPKILIALDNDDAGRKASGALHASLDTLGFRSWIVDITGKYKDANDALINDAPLLADRIAKYIDDPEQYLTGLISRIYQYHDNPECIPTGFNNLDDILAGGLYPKQLYCVGALSSLGKTTLVLQIADNLAQKQGKHVLFYSLESSRDEMSAKTISRLTSEIARGDQRPQTSRSILNGAWLDYPEKKLVENAITLYSAWQRRMHIIDATLKRPTVSSIARDVANFEADHHGERPIVVVDYLQLLATEPDYQRETDKAQVTRKVFELKKIASTYDIPVIVISSFNRANYTTSVGMESFKESGEIEYTSDVLIGLQVHAVHKAEAESKEGEKRKIIHDALEQESRDIEAVVLKNRNGRRGTVYLNYYAMYNAYYPAPEPVDDQNMF